MIEPCPEGMKRLVTMEFAVDQYDGGFHVRNSTECGDVSWAEVYRGMLEIKADIDRQIAERFNCPFHPKTLKDNGAPEFT